MTVHDPVRLVVMPGRTLTGGRFLDQHVFVKEVDLAGTHQRSGDSGGRGLRGGVAISGNTLPVAVVAKKITIGAFRRVVLGVAPRVGKILLNTFGQLVEPMLIEHTAQLEYAVAVELFDVSSADE